MMESCYLEGHTHTIDDIFANVEETTSDFVFKSHATELKRDLPFETILGNNIF